LISVLIGTAEEGAEKVAAPVKSPPQALKRGPIFNDPTARLKIVPFPNRLELGFFRDL
jgi:hypothetical protein